MTRIKVAFLRSAIVLSSLEVRCAVVAPQQRLQALYKTRYAVRVLRAACHSRVVAVKSSGEGQELDCEVRESELFARHNRNSRAMEESAA